MARRQLRVHLQHRRLQRGDVRQRAPTAHRAPLHAGHRRLRDELPAQARREGAGHRAHTVVSPQRRLRRDRVLPRGVAVRNPDAAGADFPRPSRGSPRRAREGARAGAPKIRRVRLGGLVGDRGRHQAQADAVTRGPGQRFGAALMTLTDAPVKFEYDRIPYLIAYQNLSGVRDVYGGVSELIVLESYLLKPKTKPSDTVLVFMHPIGGGAYLPMINALARAGHHVIYCNSRFRGTDSALLMEKVVEDLGECIKDAKNRLGYQKVVLAGWSGGGSLSVFYQQQANRPTVTASPAGDGPDLTKLGLLPADAIMLLAAHISRHGTLTEWLDASILDESDPTKRDPELDLYNPDNPNQPPYTPEFLERYHDAQIARNRRITKWVKEKLAEIKASGRPGADVEEFAF